MPIYKITITKDPLQIEEQQVSVGQSIKFTNFTSCMGVVCRAGKNLVGVHLVSVGKQDVPFDSKAAKQVIFAIQAAVDGADITDVTFVGNYPTWRSNAAIAMEALTTGLKLIGGGTVADGLTGDGVFMATYDEPTGKTSFKRS